MKKYCLTKCFKRKMSAFWETVIGVVLSTILIMLMFAFVGIIAFGLGYIWIEILGMPGDSFADVGISIIAISVLTALGVYFLSKVGASMTMSATQFIKDRYEGEPFECSIFEECKEEEK